MAGQDEGKESDGRITSSRAQLVLLALAVLILGVGALMGSSLGKRWVIDREETPPVVQAEAPAATPTPPVNTEAPADPDPPATETNSEPVLEDESGPPLDLKAAPVVPTPPPPQQVALALPILPPVAQGKPAWQRYALATTPVPTGRPVIAVIIDDMGVDKRRSAQAVQLPGPLTMSYMSYAAELPRQTADARAHGHELMMHVPMEPLGAGIDPGPGALLTALPAEELHRRLEQDLDSFTGYVGINNHMGSKFTAYTPGMKMVMDSLHRRGLLFIDSLTTPDSVGLAQAREAGIPTAGRNVFLDNFGDLASVLPQLAKTEELARKNGTAIAIGHPRDATLAALAGWLPTLAKKGFTLVPVTVVVQKRMAATAPATH